MLHQTAMSRKLLFICVALLAVAYVSAEDEQQPHYVDGEHNQGYEHSPEEIEEAREYFNEMDENKDGSISAEEVTNHSKKMLEGEDIDPEEEEEIKRIFQLLDRNGDGKVTFEEFLEDPEDLGDMGEDFGDLPMDSEFDENADWDDEEMDHDGIDEE